MKRAIPRRGTHATHSLSQGSLENFYTHLSEHSSDHYLLQARSGNRILTSDLMLRFRILISRSKTLRKILFVNSTSFEIKSNIDGTVEKKKYDFVFASDGAYSVVRKHFMTTQDYFYSQ